MSTLHALSENPEVWRIGWTLLHFLWQGALGAILLALVLLALRSAPPSARYAAACVTLLSFAAMPVLTYTSLGSPATSINSADPVAPLVATAPMPIAAEQSGTDSPAGVSGLQPATVHWTASLHAFLAPVVPWFAIFWFIGSSAMALRLLGGLVQAERLKRHRVTALEGDWTARVERIAGQLRITTAVQLLESAIVHSPVVLGFFKPVILLPMSALVGLAPDQMDAILAHELAHVRRRDYWVQLVQRVIEAALFYHPAVWWVSRQVSIEREHCCDDLAANACGGSYRYAQALTELARLNVAVPSYGLSLGGGSLFARIRRLLTAPDTAYRHAAWWPGGIVAILVAVFVSIAAIRVESAAAGTPAATPGADAAVLTQASPAVSPAPLAPPSDAGAPAAVRATRSSTPGIALVEFSRVGGDPALGEASAQMIELVGDRLSREPAVRLVDRSTLDRTLTELRLGASGLADAATAGSVGSLVGARYFVSGRLMKTGDEWTCTIKLIDTETSAIQGIRVEGTPEEGVATLADKAARAIGDKIAGMDLPAGAAQLESSHELAALRESLAGKTLPTIAVAIPESHIGTWVPDPAGENEVISVLTQAGYHVVDVKTFLEHEQPSWWANLFFGHGQGQEPARAGIEAGSRNPADIFKNKEIAKIRSVADVFVIGEAFSESAGEQSGFESCTARIELKALDTKSERVLWASSQHSVAADISELIAGKKALRQGGNVIGVELAKSLADSWTAPAQQEQRQ